MKTQIDEFSDRSQIKQQELLYLHQQNSELKPQMHQYQNIIKQLQSENTTLYKENEKYKNLVKQLFEQHQKKDELHCNNLLHLNNRLKQLRLENDQLRQEMESITNSNSNSKVITTIVPSQEILDLLQRDNSDLNDELEKRCYSLAIDEIENLNDIERELSAMDICSPLMIITSDSKHCDDGIMSQLSRFGYGEQDIIKAMENVNDKEDINVILEKLENQKDANYAAYDALMEQIQEKEDEIVLLQKENKDHKAKIDRLQSRVNDLRIENKSLMSFYQQKKDEEDFSFSWLKYLFYRS